MDVQNPHHITSLDTESPIDIMELKEKKKQSASGECESCVLPTQIAERSRGHWSVFNQLYE